jgi:hypothetical protein
MNLQAPPSGGPIEVPICAGVLRCGADAHADGDLERPLFPHRHTPRCPPALGDEAAWVAALDFAEDQLRYKQAGRAILDLDRTSPKGCCGGRCAPSRPRLLASPRGIEVDGALATWAQLLRGRREQREAEFEVARARDLAQAYHCLDYYGRVYGEPEERDGFDGIGEQFSPVPLIRRLAEEALKLGGDPTQLPAHTTYMRQGIEEAAASVPPAAFSAAPPREPAPQGSHASRAGGAQRLPQLAGAPKQGVNR